MGETRARDAREREDARGEREVREMARDLNTDVGLFWQGTGSRVLQVVEEPSMMEPGFAWEIRKLEDQFAVYRSSVDRTVHAGLIDAIRGLPIEAAQAALLELLGTVFVRGYSQLAVSSDKLEFYWQAVRKLAVDLSPLYESTAAVIFDAYHCQVALFGPFSSSVRFIWCSGEYPPHWEPLVGIAAEMMGTFRAAAEIGHP